MSVPPSSESAELINRFRQQMILAQVRIMEMEDELVMAQDRIGLLDRLREEAQRLADRNLDQAAHLERVRSETQHQCDYLRHMQHVTQQALDTARVELEKAKTDLAGALREGSTLRDAEAQLQARLAETLRERMDLTEQLGQAQAQIGRHAHRIGELDGEVRQLRASRSWRWTAWLRSVERLLAKGGP